MSAGQLQRASSHDADRYAAQQALSQFANGRTGIAAAVAGQATCQPPASFSGRSRTAACASVFVDRGANPGHHR